MVIPLDVIIGCHTSSSTLFPILFHGKHSSLYIHIIYTDGTLTANGNIFVWPSLHFVCREAIGFPLISRYLDARPVAKPMSFGDSTSPPVWWDKEKKSLSGWKSVWNGRWWTYWVDNSWVFCFDVLFFCLNCWADNGFPQWKKQERFWWFEMSIFIFFGQGNFLKCHSAFVPYYIALFWVYDPMCFSSDEVEIIYNPKNWVSPQS